MMAKRIAVVGVAAVTLGPMGWAMYHLAVNPDGSSTATLMVLATAAAVCAAFLAKAFAAAGNDADR